MAYLDIETNFENAATEFLGASIGIPAGSFYSTLGQDDFVTPRISIRAQLGEAKDPPTLVGNPTVLEYTQYELTLSIVVVTDASQSGSQVQHRSYRESIRQEMLLNSSNWTTSSGSSTVLPYYEVKYMRPTGTDFEVDGDLAISTLTYDILFTINKDLF
jgi:hypothetical protein